MMKRLEYRLLNSLKPGETVRFVYRRVSPGAFGFQIEGATDQADPGPFADRVGSLLALMRGQGYVFSQSTNTSGEGARGRRSGKGRRRVDIRPVTVDISAPGRAPLGFAGAHPRGDALSIPAFPLFSAPPIERCIPEILLSSKPVRGIEIEFTRRRIEGTELRPLEVALAGVAEKIGHLLGQDVAAAPMHRFLALWILQAAGWEIRCFASLAGKGKSPVGLLEALGRDLFGAECEVADETDGGTPRHAGDFGMIYPDGWDFPPLIPPAEAHGLLDVGRLINPGLPALPSKGLLLGIAEGKEVRLPRESRDRHTYLAGATGTGKSTLLFRMIVEDIEQGEGVLLIDPHGDLYRQVMQAVPKKRKKDLLVIDPGSGASPVGLNVLDIPRDDLFRRRVEFLVGELLRFFQGTWKVPDAFGPMFEIYYRNAMLLLLLGNEDRGELLGRRLTLLDFESVFSDKNFRDILLQTCADPKVVQFWHGLAEKACGEASLQNIAPYITSKVGPLTQGAFIAQMFGSERDELEIGKRLDCKEIVLINLSKGLLGPWESRLLGTIFTMQTFSAGLRRVSMRESERVPANIYIDEFQNFTSETVASMLSEARKFGLRLTLANQTLSQLGGAEGQGILDAVLGNVGNIILFRLGVPDADRLRLFIEPFTRQQMIELPNYHAMVRLLTAEGPVRPVVMKTFGIRR